MFVKIHRTVQLNSAFCYVDYTSINLTKKKKKTTQILQDIYQHNLCQHIQGKMYNKSCYQKQTAGTQRSKALKSNSETSP